MVFRPGVRGIFQLVSLNNKFIFSLFRDSFDYNFYIQYKFYIRKAKGTGKKRKALSGWTGKFPIFYYKTGHANLGAFLNGMLITWIIVAGTAMHVLI